MKVFVCNRGFAEKRLRYKGEPVISITTPDDPPAAIPATAGPVLRLSFHDLETAPGEAFGKVYGPATLFDLDMAQQIVDFVTTMLLQNNDRFVAHCDAGVSRSGAVGHWLRDAAGAELRSLKSLSPNPRVYRLLQRAHAEMQR